MFVSIIIFLLYLAESNEQKNAAFFAVLRRSRREELRFALTQEDNFSGCRYSSWYRGGNSRGGGGPRRTRWVAALCFVFSCLIESRAVAWKWVLNYRGDTTTTVYRAYCSVNRSLLREGFQTRTDPVEFNKTTSLSSTTYMPRLRARLK